MHHTAEGHRPLAVPVRCIRHPAALRFLTQLPGEALMAIVARFFFYLVLWEKCL